MLDDAPRVVTVEVADAVSVDISIVVELDISFVVTEVVELLADSLSDSLLPGLRRMRLWMWHVVTP